MPAPDLRPPAYWNATAEEVARRYPCDALDPAPQHRFVRAVDVAAPVAVTYRRLQQLRIAPYSYDWADNFLLPSPRRLTPRAATIAVGQRVMHLFRIVAFEPGATLTIGPASRLGEALFGTLHGTYAITPRANGSSRLVAVVCARYPPSLYGRTVGPLMPWIDFVMMRKQLLTLAALARRDAHELTYLR